MAKQPAELVFSPIQMSRAKSAYRVSVKHADGRTELLGTVALRWFRHIQMDGWEATGQDGHRGVHQLRKQAAKALEWDGIGYPFPIIV